MKLTPSTPDPDPSEETSPSMLEGTSSTDQIVLKPPMLKLLFGSDPKKLLAGRSMTINGFTNDYIKNIGTINNKQTKPNQTIKFPIHQPSVSYD